VAAILTGMVTPPTPVPPPRREGRRFTIPTPADLRHPRQRRPADQDDDRVPEDDAPAAEVLEAPAVDLQAAGPAPASAPPAAARDGDQRPTSEGPVPARVPTAADPTDAGSDPSRVPTPGTLPRPRGSRTASAGPGPAAEATGAPDAGATTDGAGSPGRRSFPNPATLMAAGRGARKVRPHGLRARRLPKVEETSAGGVVLDLSADPPAVALIARHDRRSRLLWSLPKGHVEEGETPEMAALREVHEETGLEGRIIAPLGVIDFWFVVEDKRIHKTVHHYVIEAVGGELSDDDIEVEAVEWIPYDQVVRRLAYGDERRLVEKVAQIVPGVR
jgi:ADP-ribose pyrophosphatase YjhB (NUDIX family)